MYVIALEHDATDVRRPLHHRLTLIIIMTLMIIMIIMTNMTLTTVSMMGIIDLCQPPLSITWIILPVGRVGNEKRVKTIRSDQ